MNAQQFSPLDADLANAVRLGLLCRGKLFVLCWIVPEFTVLDSTSSIIVEYVLKSLSDRFFTKNPREVSTVNQNLLLIQHGNLRSDH